MAKILVAEDARNIRGILADILSDAGYDVIEASDGGMALDKACQDDPDLVLLDVTMPVMDGFEVLKGLRENPDTQTIPVVLLTAMAATKGEHAALNLGADHYVTKPWEDETLQAVIRVALRDGNKAKDEEADEPNEPAPIKVIRIGELFRPLEDIRGGGRHLGSLE